MNEEMKNAIDNGQDEEVVEAYANIIGEEYFTADSCEEAYNGKWADDKSFVQKLMEDIGSIPKDLPSYIHIDWESTARDIMMDYSEYNGHYFRNL